jgi:motility quorum-sensing regulator/GCU-specific mRNA interferase toxin
MVYRMAEKRTPHHDLEKVKAAFSTREGLIATNTAITDAAALGYGSDEIVEIIKTITRSDFYKSMTSNYNATVWQDVYHVSAPDGTELYVKFTDNGGPDFVLLSFKEK